MNVYLIILIFVLISFVLIALGMMLARRDPPRPHPHWPEGNERQDAGDQRKSMQDNGGSGNNR